MADTHNVPTTGGTTVGFYQGQQAKLAELKGNYKAGSFYITTDENRLYLAKDKDNLAYLNKSIVEVADQAALFALSNPLPGEFYYVKDGNILCYYASDADVNEPNVGSNGHWIQVNVDTNTNTWHTVSDFSFLDDSGAVEGGDGKLTGYKIKAQLTVTNNDGDDIETFNPELTISKSEINNLVDAVADVTGGAIDNGAELAFDGMEDPSVERVHFVGDGSVTVDYEQKDAVGTITISGTTYGLDLEDAFATDGGDTTSSSTAIILKDNDGKIVSGIGIWGSGTAEQHENNSVENEDILVVSQASGGEESDSNCFHNNIVIKHKNYAAYDAPEVDDAEPGHGASFTILKNVTTSNGHVTGVETAEITLPSITPLENADIASVTADSAGKITLTKVDGNTIESGEVLYYTINDTTYKNQAALDEGIQAYIARNLANITNSMTFKGGLAGGTEAIPTNIETLDKVKDGVSIGDTFIVTSGFISVGDDDSVATTGDIIIANGTENDNGIIAVADVDWTVVPGTEVDTTYEVRAEDNQIGLYLDNGNQDTAIDLADDDVVILTTTPKEANGVNSKITASHVKIGEDKDGTKNDTDGTAWSQSSQNHQFSAVSGVTYDEYGHVSGVETTEYTLRDEWNDHQLVAMSPELNLVGLANSTGYVTSILQVAAPEKVVDEVDNPIQVVLTSTEVPDAEFPDYTRYHLQTFTITHDAYNEDNLMNFQAGGILTEEEIEESGVEPTPLNKGDAFVIPHYAVNQTGHITETVVNEYVVTDTQYELQAATLSAENNVATVQHSLETTDGAAAGTAEFSIASTNDNLTVTASGTQVSLGLVWGTF